MANKICCAALAAVWLLSGCRSSESSYDLPAAQQISKPTGEGIINIDLTERDKQMVATITNIPPDAEITCTLNDEPLPDCKDQMSFNYNETGDYVFAITAKRNGETVGYGESRFQNGQIAADLNAARNEVNAKHPLALAIDDPNFSNGSAIKVGTSVTIKFKHRNDPQCTPEYQCSYDSRTNMVWRACDNKTSETIPKGLMARGLQYLSVQAHCGDTVGPVMQVFWYGVDQDYVPLALNTFLMGKNKSRTFLLSKANDCPEGLLKFECSASAREAFRVCKNKQPTINAGFRIRAVCNGTPGPTFVATN